MQRSFPRNPKGVRTSTYAGLLLVVLCIVFILPESMFHFGSRRRELARAAQARIDILNYTAALNAYSNHFGALPVGDNARVTSLLTGSNEQHLVFFALGTPSKQINALGELLDPNDHPYDIEVTTNRIRISQRPQ